MVFSGEKGSPYSLNLMEMWAFDILKCNLVFGAPRGDESSAVIIYQLIEHTRLLELTWFLSNYGCGCPFSHIQFVIYKKKLI